MLSIAALAKSLAAETPAPASTPRAFASSGEGAYEAAFALDGNPATRWSSRFTDNEWWAVEFPERRRIGGMRIRWETAFGEKYTVLTSLDGDTWTAVYNVTEGDGQSDCLFFGPAEARFVKIQGLQRGTGWGYSIWEIEFFDDATLPAASASSSRDGATASLAIDGDRATAWQSGNEAETALTIRLPYPMRLGGFELGWDDNHAASYRIDVSADGTNWNAVCNAPTCNGGTDLVYFPPTAADLVRVHCRPRGGQGCAIAHFELKGEEEAATPLRSYKAAAREVPRGWYPMWMSRQQEFWTITGTVDDEHETLLGETGTVEPRKNSFCVMPFILEGTNLVSWADVALAQSLADGYLPLPTAAWDRGLWRLEVSMVTVGPTGASSTAVRYRFENRGDAPFTGRLALAVRPVQLNPPWQYGGHTAIRNVRWDRDNGPSTLVVDGTIRLIACSPPSTLCAAGWDQGDVVSRLSEGGTGQMQAESADGLASAALFYDLRVSAGEARDFVVLFPLHDGATPDATFFSSPAEAFSDAWLREAESWRRMLNRVVIRIPEPRLVDVLRSNLAYILLNKDGPWIKPGPRNYNHAWIRDGSLTGTALLRMGITEPLRPYLEAYSKCIGDNGWAPFNILEGGNPVAYSADLDGGENHEYDSQGQYPFLVRQYVDYTHDDALLQELYPRVVATLDFARQLRRLRMTHAYRDNPANAGYYGILPKSNSHEGYYPAMHSYWDDFWMLRGLADGAALAELMGNPDDATWMRTEAQDLQACLSNSLQSVIRRDHLDYIPGCVEKGDFDATSTAIAMTACSVGDLLPEPYRRRTFEKYFEDFLQGTIPGRERMFTPYEVRSAEAFVRMGDREKALAMLRYFTRESARPFAWNHFAEVVHARVRTPSYIGDMPHTWVGSGYINAVRSLFAYEENGTLVLAAGVDPAWLSEEVGVENLPTQFGSISYRIRRRGGIIQFAAHGDAMPPDGFILALPDRLRICARGADVPAVEINNGQLRFSSLPVAMSLEPAGN